MIRKQKKIRRDPGFHNLLQGCISNDLKPLSSLHVLKVPPALSSTTLKNKSLTCSPLGNIPDPSTFIPFWCFFVLNLRIHVYWVAHRRYTRILGERSKIRRERVWGKMRGTYRRLRTEEGWTYEFLSNLFPYYFLKTQRK
jgi:hypothetical protein